jgi:hypothetical protein
VNYRSHKAPIVALAALVMATPVSVSAQQYSPRPPSYVLSGPPYRPQDFPDREVMRQVNEIVNDRPREAEAAATAFLINIARHRTDPRSELPRFPIMEQLKAANPDAYWREVAELVMQFEILRRASFRDSLRGSALIAMFGAEFELRALQRGWKQANEADRRTMRTQIETMVGRKVDAEDRLRELEMADIERRLADARTESERRRTRRAEVVRNAVDDFIIVAGRPE